MTQAQLKIFNTKNKHLPDFLSLSDIKIAETIDIREY